ncbi:hypothetical protein HY374_00100 [Candidatus Berkelbacteria bacterium]|nr:hypothetical protein [Candidatus Berkelbacteria bacterium]
MANKIQARRRCLLVEDYGVRKPLELILRRVLPDSWELIVPEDAASLAEFIADGKQVDLLLIDEDLSHWRSGLSWRSFAAELSDLLTKQARVFCISNEHGKNVQEMAEAFGRDVPYVGKEPRAIVVATQAALPAFS